MIICSRTIWSERCVKKKLKRVACGRKLTLCTSHGTGEEDIEGCSLHHQVRFVLKIFWKFHLFPWISSSTEQIPECWSSSGIVWAQRSGSGQLFVASGVPWVFHLLPIFFLFVINNFHLEASPFVVTLYTSWNKEAAWIRPGDDFVLTPPPSVSICFCICICTDPTTWY